MLNISKKIRRYLYNIINHAESPFSQYVEKSQVQKEQLQASVQELYNQTNSILEQLKEQNAKIEQIKGQSILIKEYIRHTSIVNRFLRQYSTKECDIKYNNHFINYYYCTLGNTTNLGDYIQTIATEKAIKTCCGYNIHFFPVQRDRLVSHKGGTCVMQGWYEHETLDFLPGPDTKAIWVGTHFTDSTCQSLETLFCNSAIRPHDVGCRDKATLSFCQQHGITSYFSRCLTLTLPKRTEEEDINANIIYIVDCSEEIIALIPNHIKNNAKIITQRGFKRESWQSWQICKDAAKNLLKEYRENAKLVITTALHCAQPCIAMGIPVVFINPEYSERNRFSSMDGIIPQYTIQDLKDNIIDFSPSPPDIENLKSALLTNLRLSMKEERNEEEKDILANVRNIIEKFNVLPTKA